MEEANVEYTMLMSADQWGQHGKPNQGCSAKMLYTRYNRTTWLKSGPGCSETIPDTTVHGQNK